MHILQTTHVHNFDMTFLNLPVNIFAIIFEFLDAKQCIEIANNIPLLLKPIQVHNVWKNKSYSVSKIGQISILQKLNIPLQIIIFNNCSVSFANYMSGMFNDLRPWDNELRKLTKVSSLRCVVIHGKQKFTINGLKFLNNHSSRTLRIGNCSFLTNKAYELMRNMPLETVELLKCHNFTNECIEYFNKKTLTDLTLTKSKLNDDGLKKLSQFTKIIKITLHYSFNLDTITNSGIECLKHLSLLKTLDLSYIQDLHTKYIFTTS